MNVFLSPAVWVRKPNGKFSGNKYISVSSGLGSTPGKFSKFPIFGLEAFSYNGSHWNHQEKKEKKRKKERKKEKKKKNKERKRRRRRRRSLNQFSSKFCICTLCRSLLSRYLRFRLGYSSQLVS